MITEKQKIKIKEIIADKLGYDFEEVNDSDNLRDNLCVDSLDMVELVMETEKDFDIAIPDEEADEIKTVEDFYPIIDKLRLNAN